MPFRMNKLDITVQTMSKTTTVFDDVFREPQLGQKKYVETTIPEIAQFKNSKFQKLDFSDSDNNGLISKARLVISKVDWQYIKDTYNIELKKGDVITKIGSNVTKLRIDEIKPTGFINGDNTLYFLELVDFNVVVGGVV
jgi:hypothetical protein